MSKKKQKYRKKRVLGRNDYRIIVMTTNKHQGPVTELVVVKDFTIN